MFSTRTSCKCSAAPKPNRSNKSPNQLTAKVFNPLCTQTPASVSHFKPSHFAVFSLFFFHSFFPPSVLWRGGGRPCLFLCSKRMQLQAACLKDGTRVCQDGAPAAPILTSHSTHLCVPCERDSLGSASATHSATLARLTRLR